MSLYDGRYPLWDLLRELRSHRFVDLTHAFGPGIPHAPRMPDEIRTVLYDFEPDGFRTHKYDHVGQWGTHVDPPIHFAKDGRSVDEIDVRDMVLPLVVFDASQAVRQNPDHALSVEEVTLWEERHGRVPDGAFAALRTDWSLRWPDADALKNVGADGVSHAPGWSVAALRFLCERRNIAACDHETADTDPGRSVTRHEFPARVFAVVP